MKTRLLYHCFFAGLLLLSTSAFGQLQWSPIPVELDGAVDAIYANTVSDRLYITGSFLSVDSQMSSGIAVFNGTTWDTLPSHGSPDISALEVYQDTLYIAGGGAIKKWTGTIWTDVGITNQSVTCLGEMDNELWAGGQFDSITGVIVEGLAKWNGKEWTSAFLPRFSGELDCSNDLRSIIQYKNHKYVGSRLKYSPLCSHVYDFQSDFPMLLIAQQDNQAWTDLDGGIRVSSWFNIGDEARVSKMIEYNGDLYVMGDFPFSNGNVDRNIMRWNGDTWLDCAGGTSGQIDDAVVYQGKLWVVGSFNQAGGVPVEGLAAWDGEKWCGTGNDFDVVPSSIGVFQESLILGGVFQVIDGDSISYLAYWTGAGDFDSCGVLWPVGIEKEQLAAQSNINIYPNPTSNITTITSNSPMQQINIFNSQGALTKRHLGTNALTFDIQLDGQPNGLYFLRIKTEEETVTKKILKTAN